MKHLFWSKWRAGLGLLGLLLAAAPAARSQQVLVQANVADDTVRTTFGPNRRYFGHFYLGYGLVAGPAAPGAAVRYGTGSAELRGGGRLKVRFSQTVAATVDLGYAFLRYQLMQDGQKLIPTPAPHRAENLGLHQLYSEASLRLNAGRRRGNSVGRYLDLLAGGGWVAATHHTTEDDPAPGIGRVETTEYGLLYLRRWSGHAGARLGLDRYALTARYRLSPAFGPAYAAWPELPRWVLGIEVGLF